MLSRYMLAASKHILPILNAMHPQACSKLNRTRLALQQPAPLLPSLSVCQQLQYCQWCSLMGLHTQLTTYQQLTKVTDLPTTAQWCCSFDRSMQSFVLPLEQSTALQAPLDQHSVSCVWQRNAMMAMHIQVYVTLTTATSLPCNQ